MLSVKSIFKTLIGTIVVIVVFSMITEIFNISVVGLQINQLSKLAAKQSAVLFSQETYKQYDSGGTIAIFDVVDRSGHTYIRGNFYGDENKTPLEIYNNLYRNSKFYAWVDDMNNKSGGVLDKLKLLKSGLQGIIPSSSMDSIVATNYVNSLYTPLNLGYPYLDKDVMNRMFKWELAQILSNTHSDQINGSYVFYKGFDIYADQANISNLDYRVFDLTKPSEADEFQDVTNLDPTRLTDKTVIVVGIEYVVPVAYEGVTPLKNIFSYVFGHKSSNESNKSWNSSKQNLISGGFNGDTTGTLPIPGKLVYYIVQ